MGAKIQLGKLALKGHGLHWENGLGRSGRRSIVAERRIWFGIHCTGTSAHLSNPTFIIFFLVEDTCQVFNIDISGIGQW
jgi:hypothetical protein